MAGYRGGYGGNMGGFGGGFNMQQLMKQAQKMQEDMEKAKEELLNSSETTFHGKTKDELMKDINKYLQACEDKLK